jgi:hypothetical protein
VRLKLTRIGRIVRPRRGGPLVTVLGSTGKPMALPRKGYEHFA